ncbi:MAG: cation:proton antiporter [SAR202 cluster bacterium]|nr:cation:proton antiporter [SAR202 cluster bacterium]
MTDAVVVFGVVAAVLTVSALISGVIDRSPLSFPLMFLGLGLALGAIGLDGVQLGPHDQILEVVATLTLALVLFLDAAKLQVSEMGRRWLVPFLVLAPGTGLAIGVGAVPLALLVGFDWTLAFIGGAILASTDPVVLREIVRDSRIPRAVRQTLRIEAGMNDLVVLPVVLVLIAVARSEVGGSGERVTFLAKLLIVGPVVGFAIGGFGAWLMSQVDARLGVRQEHQALYGIGLVLAAYASATAVGGDGFLGAFAGGFAVVALNQQLCDCFLDFGETIAEMAMLLSFVLFGVVLSGLLGDVSWATAVPLAAIVIFVIRPSVLSLLLVRVKASWRAKAIICWFGPRGLNSLLLALLVVVAGVDGSELMLATIGVVVIASLIVHSSTVSPVSAWYQRKALSETLEEEREGTVADLFGGREGATGLIGVDDLNDRMGSPNPPIVLDVRSRAHYEADDQQISGSVRVLPDQVTDWAATQAPDRSVVAYCD